MLDKWPRNFKKGEVELRFRWLFLIEIFSFLNYSLDLIISLLTSYWNNKWRKITCGNVKTIESKRDKERENTKPRIYPGSATIRAYIQSPNNPLEIFTILIKSFTSNEPQRNLVICVQWSQPRSYAHFLQWTQKRLVFWVQW